MFNSHNFVLFIVIYSFQEGQVNHYVCMLYKFYIILLGISLIFIDRLEEENKNSTTGAQNYLIWSPHQMCFFLNRTKIVCSLSATKCVLMEQNKTILFINVFSGGEVNHSVCMSIIKLSCVCLSVCHHKSNTFLNHHSAAKWSLNFTKLSGWVKIGLLPLSKILLSTHMHACIHSEPKCAHNF